MNGIDDAVSAMAASRDRLDAATHDLANGGSDGFHGSVVRARMTAHGLATQRVADARQGVLRSTGRPYDLALVGTGAFRVLAPGPHAHPVASRDGAFVRDRFGHLVDGRGRMLLGEGGPVRVGERAELRTDGAVLEDGRIVARIPLHPGTQLRQGFIEGSNVDGVARMMDVIDAQRSFESAQKVLSAVDEARQKAVNETGQVKG